MDTEHEDTTKRGSDTFADLLGDIFTEMNNAKESFEKTLDEIEEDMNVHTDTDHNGTTK